MSTSILDLYAAQQSTLGVDTITPDNAIPKQTPYSDDSRGNPDEGVLNDDFLKYGRNGILNETSYMSTVVYNP